MIESMRISPVRRFALGKAQRVQHRARQVGSGARWPLAVRRRVRKPGAGISAHASKPNLRAERVFARIFVEVAAADGAIVGDRVGGGTRENGARVVEQIGHVELEAHGILADSKIIGACRGEHVARFAVVVIEWEAVP